MGRRPDWRGAGVCVFVTVLLWAGGGAEECNTDDQNPPPHCTTPSDDSDFDEESDAAPFLIVVEHEDGWRCAGSLVSLRTAVTSARCVRGRSNQLPRELWALAAAQLARRQPSKDGHFVTRFGATLASTARRISRLALAGDRSRGENPVLDDLAVLELEAPFGSGAQARPIVMATLRGECDKEAICHAVRAVPAEGLHRAKFRVISATIVPGAHCASRVTQWPDMSDRAMCLSGEELCMNDRGTGLVCNGKLCGVLSESSSESITTATKGCGETHVAQSVARWRKFLHCAHTLRACGSGDCESLCSEHRLLNGETSSEMENIEAETVALTTVSSANTTVKPMRRQETTSTQRNVGPVAEVYVESATDPSRFPARHVPEFEPNRPDFKAGEYGDNAADYDEAVPSIRTRSQSVSVTRSQYPAIHSVTRTHSTSPITHSPPPAESLRSTAACYEKQTLVFTLSQLIFLIHSNCLKF